MNYQYYVVYHKLTDDHNYSAIWKVYDKNLKLLFSYPITTEYFNSFWCYYYQGGGYAQILHYNDFCEFCEKENRGRYFKLIRMKKIKNKDTPTDMGKLKQIIYKLEEQDKARQSRIKKYQLERDFRE